MNIVCGLTNASSKAVIVNGIVAVPWEGIRILYLEMSIVSLCVKSKIIFFDWLAVSILTVGSYPCVVFTFISIVLSLVFPHLIVLGDVDTENSKEGNTNPSSKISFW